jgi:hypothetical protein
MAPSHALELRKSQCACQHGCVGKILVSLQICVFWYRARRQVVDTNQHVLKTTTAEIQRRLERCRFWYSPRAAKKERGDETSMVAAMMRERKACGSSIG